MPGRYGGAMRVFTDHWSLWCLVAGFAVLAIAETVTARAPGDRPKTGRLASNFGLGAVNIVIAALLPIGTVGAASAADGGRLLGLVPTVAAVAALLVLRSFAAYWLHRACHRVPFLWRWHRVHHNDAAVDVSTGFRNHPVEALLAIGIASGVVFAFAPPVAAVIVVDTILLIAAFWQHADIALPRGLSRVLEWIAVTPDFHRIHHSTDRADYDTNYGDITTIWDRLFGSLRSPERSRDGERAIV